MSKTYRPWNIDQAMLLPPSVQELMPPGHPAHFIRDLVRDSLDLSAIVDDYSEERGYPPYDQVMMTALLLYSYCQGVYSSRRMARACEQRVDFMAGTAMQKPDFRTISDFRKRHLQALGYRPPAPVARQVRAPGLPEWGPTTAPELVAL